MFDYSTKKIMSFWIAYNCYYCLAGVVIAVTSLAILHEVFIIIVRFVNIGLINIKIKIFLIIVSIASRISLNQLHIYTIIHWPHMKIWTHTSLPCFAEHAQNTIYSTGLNGRYKVATSAFSQLPEL